MIAFDVLLDSNVVVAVVVKAHEHHATSLALLTRPTGARFAVSAHSYAEAYSTLTRRSDRAPFAFTAGEAWASLASLRAVTGLIGLTPAQTFEATSRYAAAGGTGPRLHDALIGETAVLHGIPGIVTWNTGHMRGLLPNLDVLTPEAFAARRAARG